MQYEIEFYIQKNGSIPFETWLQGLDQKTHNRIMARLDRVQLGNFGDHKTVGGGVFDSGFSSAPATVSITALIRENWFYY